MGCGSSTSKFSQGGPAFQASDDWRMFDDGILYMLRDKQTGIWGFYNDSKDCLCYVLLTFEIPEGKKVLPPKRMGGAMMEDLGDRKFRASVMIYPGETEIMMEAKYVIWFETVCKTEGLTKHEARKLRKERKDVQNNNTVYDTYQDENATHTKSEQGELAEDKAEKASEVPDAENYVGKKDAEKAD